MKNNEIVKDLEGILKLLGTNQPFGETVVVGKDKDGDTLYSNITQKGLDAYYDLINILYALKNIGVIDSAEAIERDLDEIITANGAYVFKPCDNKEKEKREMKEFKTTRTEEEIYEYLMLTNKGFDKGIVFGLIEDAQTVENKYYNELLDHKYEYACACDFINSPFILEDEDDDIELVKVEQIGGIVVYEKRNLKALYEEYKKEWLKDHNVSEEEQIKKKKEYEQYLKEEWENPEFFTLDDFIFLCNGYEAGCYVCFDEWYNNEYQQMLEENNEKEVM